MRSRALAGALAVAAALAFPGASLAARYTVGLRPGADPASVAAAVERVSGKRPASLEPLRALSAVGHPRAAAGDTGRRVGRARPRAPGVLRPDRPAGSAAVVRGRESRVRRVGDPAAARAGACRGDRLRDRPRPPRPGGAHRRSQELRRRHRPGHARATGPSSRASSRPTSTTRRASPVSPRPRSSWSPRSSRRGGTISVQAEAQCDPLGRRQRRPGAQHQPRRPPRPAQPGSRHLLAAREGGDRLRGEARRRRSLPRWATPTRRRARRGGSRATRRRCRTCSASAR